MNKIITFFNKPSILALATMITIIGGGGIYGGINWLFKGIKPYYSIKSTTVKINDIAQNLSPGNLELNYIKCNHNDLNNCERKQIDTITQTTILLWNGGWQTIREADIKDNPIKIITKDNVEILELSLLHVENPDSNFNLDKKNRLINFSFLEFRQGGLIQVFHTGYGDNEIIIDGYVIDSTFGNGQLKKINSSELYRNDNYTIILLFFFISLTISFVLIYKKRNDIINYLNKETTNIWLIFWFYVAYIVLMLAFVFLLPILTIVAVQHKNMPSFLGMPEKSYEMFRNQ